ncbi:MAG: hypothetical protein M3209_18885 [Acidobacteriota bacterium]|nr:hypothetical protein [Acidobacteriota bacterium]
MTPKEISRIIEKEINGDWLITNWHNVDLKRCLVRPRKKLYSSYQNEPEKFWLILEECPETLECYKIVFDEKTKRFGLAQFSEPYDVILGWYDSFIEAFKAM